MKRLLCFMLLFSSFSYAQLNQDGSRVDIDEEIQGDPTSVTKNNLCVKEKLKAFNPINGTIPLVAGSLPASDLLCDSDECGSGVLRGQVLTQNQAKTYFKTRFSETRCQWTLADLEPQQDPELWENKIGSSLDSSLDNLEVEDMDKVNYVSEAWGRLGSYRITVNKYNDFGTPVQYSLLLSKTIHNYILRKSLLRKLGYKVPPVKWLKRVKVKFRTKKEVNNFISKLSINNAGSFDRWILNRTNNNEVILQDVVIMEDQEFDLNLSKGYVSSELSGRKRILDSLIIPFSLVEVPESINMFDWTFGREYSNNLVVKYPLTQEFQTSFYDALWISRRIMKLSENDWWEIVESTNLPSSIKLLLFHKLKARRNHLAEIMNIDNIELPYDTKVSNQDDLIDGEIQKEFYDGFARRFKIPDPESPISGDQMRSFFKSKAITTGLNMFADMLNSQKFMGTDVSSKVGSKIEKIMADNVATSTVTGAVTKTPIKTYFFPTVQGALILNREIVAGAYLGTDNRLQLVDSIGGAVSAGVFGGVTGIYTKTGKKVLSQEGLIRQQIPVSLTAHSQINVSRTYSHVRPIRSIDQGLKYPFKNLFVPNILKKHSNVFNTLLSDQFQADYQQDSDAASSKVIELLNQNIEIGESVIITDSISADINAKAKFDLYQVVDLKLGVKPKKLVLSRLHILRKSDEEFHIYKSLGNSNSVELSAALENKIPITKVIFKVTKGTARTKYYRVMIGNKDQHGNVNVHRNDKIKGLASVFATGAVAGIHNVEKPYVLIHRFSEGSTKFGIFVWRWNWLNQNDNITVLAPTGKEINLFRRMEGKSKGRDVENYVEDVVKGLSGELLNYNFGFKNVNAGNPGFTYYGRAKNFVATYEGIKTPEGTIAKPFMKLSRIYNGWKLSQKKAIDKLNDIKRRYQHELFKPEVLAQTEELFLYNININFFVHTRGIEYILSQHEDKIKNIWETYSRRSDIKSRNKLLKDLKWYKKYESRNRTEKMSEMGLSILKTIESHLSMDGITSMFGGARNILVIGKIDGFRVGDENGDQSIISSSIGREGSESVRGPLGTIQKFLGMTTGEFYINWMLGRII